MSTPVRIIKVPSVESGDWSATGARRLNFDIPASTGLVNLDKSYVLLKTEINCSETETDTVVRPVAIAGGEPSLPAYDSDALCKHAYLEAERAGRLEDANYRNILQQNLDFYSKSQEDMQSDTVYNGAFEFDEFQKRRSVFRNIRYLEDNGDSCTYSGAAANGLIDGVKPAILTPEIRIPLKKIAKFASGMKQYPCQLMGDTRLHMELEDSIKLVHGYESDESWELRSVDLSGTSAATRSQAVLHQQYQDPRDLHLYAGMPITLGYSEVAAGNVLNAGDFTFWTNPSEFSADSGVLTVSGTDISCSNTSLQGMTLQLTFTNPTNQFSDTVLDVDVCVGSTSGDIRVGDTFRILEATMASVNMDADVEFVVTGNDATPNVKEVTSYITGLTHNYNSVSGDVLVKWNDAFDSCANHQAGDIAFTHTAQTAEPTWNITEANLVLHQLVLSPAQVESFQKNVSKGVDIPYHVWDLERVNVQASETAFTRQYRLEPMTGNVIGLNPRSTLVSEQDQVDKFRFQINGTFTTDEDVEVHEPLYHDRIISTWANMNAPLKNLDEDFSRDTTETLYTNDPMIVPQPVPLMPMESLLQVDLKCTDGAMSQGNFYMYKMKQRMLKLTGDRAELQN